jgi:hypothetical protein
VVPVYPLVMSTSPDLRPRFDQIVLHLLQLLGVHVRRVADAHRQRTDVDRGDRVVLQRGVPPVLGIEEVGPGVRRRDDLVHVVDQTAHAGVDWNHVRLALVDDSGHLLHRRPDVVPVLQPRGVQRRVQSRLDGLQRALVDAGVDHVGLEPRLEFGDGLLVAAEARGLQLDVGVLLAEGRDVAGVETILVRVEADGSGDGAGVARIGLPRSHGGRLTAATGGEHHC